MSKPDESTAYVPCAGCGGDPEWCQCCACCHLDESMCECVDNCGYDHLGVLRARVAELEAAGHRLFDALNGAWEWDATFCNYAVHGGACSMGCREEPSCMTDRPKGGWPGENWAKLTGRTITCSNEDCVECAEAESAPRPEEGS